MGGGEGYITVDADFDHLTEVVCIRFIHSPVLLLPFHIILLGRKLVEIHIENRELHFT